MRTPSQNEGDAPEGVRDYLDARFLNSRRGTPPMPDGFADRAAWDAIHWNFSVNGCLLDTCVIDWQRDNQERVKAAIRAAGQHARLHSSTVERAS